MVEIILLISIIITIFLTRLFEKRGLISPTLSRKTLHVVAIGISALVPLLSSNIAVVKWIVGLSMPITFVLVSREFFPRDESGRKSWGIFYYTVVFFCLLTFFPYQPRMVFYPLMVMALADGLATVVGKRFGRPIQDMEEFPKTIAGSFTFFVVCAAVLVFSPMMDASLRHFLPIGTLVLISGFLAAVEFITKNGRDNIWVPVAVVYWLDTGRFLGENAMWYALITVLLALLALRYRWLTRDGLLAAFIIGILLLFSPDPRAIIPALVFFGLGSLVSKLPGSKTQKATSRRTAVQVFSNGLAPSLSFALYFVSANEIWLYAGMAGFATAMSDTISSELGMRFGATARD
ncbi:MAG: DUF92 domain-containing protein, partial [Cryomorphaceae bacterium]|nr:DUF92 domain-containing protein [Flavobacteriales bacterium]